MSTELLCLYTQVEHAYCLPDRIERYKEKYEKKEKLKRCPIVIFDKKKQSIFIISQSNSNKLNSYFKHKHDQKSDPLALFDKFNYNF